MSGHLSKRTRPHAQPALLDEVPGDLRGCARWVCWSYRQPADGKWTKVPADAKTGGPASSTDPSTWSEFSTARARYEAGGVNGVGFVLGDGIVGVDLDGHRDPESGVLTPLALGILGRLGTYAEVSPSGRGVHALLRGKKPAGRCRRDDTQEAHVGIEIYDDGRYFTVSGRRLVGVPFYGDAPATVEPRQAELDALYVKLLGATNGGGAGSEGKAPASDSERQVRRDALSDDGILDLAGRARNGEKFRRLFEGDASGYGSRSEADFALCSLVAFYCGSDPARIDRLFRRSKLMRSKWDERRGELTYGQLTINKALEGRTDFYSAGAAKISPASHTASKKLRVEFDYWTEALDEMTQRAWVVLRQANDPPFMFRSGSAPVRIEFEDDGSPFLRPVTDHRLRHALMEIAEWHRWIQSKNNGHYERTPLPAQLLNNMLACPEIPLPILTGIVEAPVFSADGKLQTTPGYHPSTRTFFDASSGIEVPPVSDCPSAEEVAKARELILEETLGDFPFVAEAERAHTVAMFLLPFARELIPGPTPLHLIEKPSPGTGATLLAELPGLVFSGRATAALTEGRDEDEWRKRLFAKLRKGPSITFIDNLRRRLESAAFSSALTAWPFWEDRILGVSETLRVPVRTMWIASGNNPAVSSEISRRTVRIRLDAKMDRPWLRRDFRHPKLRYWVKENRGQLVWACLTLISSWISTGRPPGSQSLGMFEDWAHVIGGILMTAEIPGFLRNLEEMYERSDEEGAAWRSFLLAWWERFGESEVRAKDLYPLTEEVDGLQLGEGSERAQQTRLGRLLGQQRDRTYQLSDHLVLRVERAREAQHSTLWRLRRAEAQ